MDGDLCGLWIVLAIVIIVVAMIWSPSKENFTIAERNGLLCPPFLNNREAHLMPNSVAFVIQGYNYAQTPKIYRDGKKITPLQYAWDSDSMAYYFVVSSPFGLEGSQWILETSDFVEPVVYEGRTYVHMNLTLLRRREGYNRWEMCA